MTKTQHDIVRQGYQALLDSLGVVDTIRFIQYFSLGRGDYTQERHEWLDRTPLDEILLSMRRRPEGDVHQYDEIIE